MSAKDLVKLWQARLESELAYSVKYVLDGPHVAGHAAVIAGICEMIEVLKSTESVELEFFGEPL
jgi:hypothetical protein